MIRSLKETEIVDDKFVVCDIENCEDGRVISIDTCWRENGELTHTLCYSWKEWVSWLRMISQEDKRFRKIYAHNGGGWDWISLAQYLVFDYKETKEISCVVATSTLVIMQVKFTENITISFVDSLQLLRSSLDRLASTFLHRNKIDLKGKMPWDIWKEDKHTFLIYQKQDTELLICVLEKALDLIREKIAKIGSFGLTIGSTAMKIFKTIGISHDISTPDDPFVRDFLRRGYRGGRVDVFQPGYFPDISVYDINSLYPYVMMTTPVPSSNRGVWVNKFSKEGCGVYDISFIQNRRDIPPVMLLRGEGKYAGRGVYFASEIALLQEVDFQSQISVHEGYRFLDTEILFENFISKLYKLRLSDPDGPISLLCKFIANSSYGKFGQRTERKIICSGSAKELMRKYDSVEPFHKMEDLSICSKEQPCAFEHVGIAGQITASSRVHLYRGFLELKNEQLVYSDTDSIHTTGNLPDRLVGRDIGLFKLEFRGEGVYAGKKLYSLRNSDSVKTRAKGISTTNNTAENHNACGLGFDDLLGVLRGEKIKCVFKRPNTIKQVLMGKQSCTFVEKARIIRDVSDERKRNTKIGGGRNRKSTRTVGYGGYNNSGRK